MMKQNINELTPLFRQDKAKDSIKLKVLVLSISFFIIGISLTIWRIVDNRNPHLNKQSADHLLYGDNSTNVNDNILPYSNPKEFGFLQAIRPEFGKPGNVFKLVQDDGVGNHKMKSMALPTNKWYQNLLLGTTYRQRENNVFQIPNVIDTAGPVAGIRTHGVHVQTTDRSVSMLYDEVQGLTLGSTEPFDNEGAHQVILLPNNSINNHHYDRNKDNNDASTSSDNSNDSSFNELAISLKWSITENKKNKKKNRNNNDNDSDDGTTVSKYMQSDVVRGSPYTTMTYSHTTPYVFSQLTASFIEVDDGNHNNDINGVIKNSISSCNNCNDNNVSDGDINSSVNNDNKGNSETNERSAASSTLYVKHRIRVTFAASDMTWLIFVSEPMEFACNNYINNQQQLPPGVISNNNGAPGFELIALRPLNRGMIRLALANNCTTGANVPYCQDVLIGGGRGRDNYEYEKLLVEHAHIYPTSSASIEHTLITSNKMKLTFDWKPQNMRDIYNNNNNNNHSNDDGYNEKSMNSERDQLLMFSLPHHRIHNTDNDESIVSSSSSSIATTSNVKGSGCTPTIHGISCPMLLSSGKLELYHDYYDVSMHSIHPVREEMIGDIQQALLTDVNYDIPENYHTGAGDTYFSGKMLAKLARIVGIAHQMNVSYDQRQLLLNRLRSGIEIWYNGTAKAPLLYDDTWGGMVSCGCAYFIDPNTNHGACANAYPNCPALTDVGMNFGNGYYNDHHYHYGYHIYAAAILSYYDPIWALQYHEHVMFMIRDIANAYKDDPYFPMYRHKDWFLGFSWSSGIVTVNGQPYFNGRNSESSSEAIAAYEAVALYGKVMIMVLQQKKSKPLMSQQQLQYRTQLINRAKQLYHTGRTLMSTEIASANVYWHVQTKYQQQVYGDVYKAKTVGMIWNVLLEQQTWFGNQPWLSYGIQLIPITSVSETRDSVAWAKEMIPQFFDTCLNDAMCESEGWSIVLYTAMAAIGHWQTARVYVLSLPLSVFQNTAGGNGHSLTNTLYYIATCNNNV